MFLLFALSALLSTPEEKVRRRCFSIVFDMLMATRQISLNFEYNQPNFDFALSTCNGNLHCYLGNKHGLTWVQNMVEVIKEHGVVGERGVITRLLDNSALHCSSGIDKPG